MSTYLIKFALVVDEDTEEDAVEAARHLVANWRTEPSDISDMSYLEEN
jgi:hypothetical protein